MSIQVTNNGDGTLTVTCGAESMIVAPVTTDPGHVSTGQHDWPPVTAGGGGVTASLVKWPLVTVGGGGVTASLVRALGAGVEVDRKVVGSQADMDKCLESLGAGPPPARFEGRGGRRVLRIELRGDEPLDLAPISELWRTGLKERYTFCEVHLTGKDG